MKDGKTLKAFESDGIKELSCLQSFSMKTQEYWSSVPEEAC